MGNTDRDALWVERALKDLPSVAVPATLERSILADFDAVAARRGRGVSGLFDRLRDAIWPGAPAWQPAALLGAALAIGLMAGVFVPLESAMAESPEQQTVSVSPDEPPAFELGESS
jgi:hypothetical protein